MDRGASLQRRCNDQSFLDMEGRKTTFSPLKINNIKLNFKNTYQIIAFFKHLLKQMCFLGGSVVKNLPNNAGDRVQSLDWEDPLEKEMATHSSILAWETPWTEEPGRGIHGGHKE